LLRVTTKAVPRLSGDGLVADEDVTVGRYLFQYRIEFPADYPCSPPTFRLLQPQLPRTEKLHIFSDGSLCLLGVDEWSPLLTAAALRARAVLWCNCIVAYLSSGTFIQPTRPKTRS